MKFVLIFLFTCSYGFLIAQDQGQSLVRGKALYETNCKVCHMDKGQGMEGVFPPLLEKVTLADTDRLVKVIRRGIKGAVTINGIAYNGVMNGFDLSDQEVADLINFLRKSWGNDGDPILPKDVQPALNAETPNYTPYN